MRIALFFLLSFFCLTGKVLAQPIAFAVHGGAGAADSARMSPELRQAITVALTEAVQTGYGILEKGGTSLEAVEAAIILLENSPLFNAGRGAVTTATGICELDAAIMDGKTGMAGAVAGLHHIKNPIVLARLVKDSTKHVMLIGEGAEAFAKTQQVDWVSPLYFLDKTDLKGKAPEVAQLHDTKFGTVGAVALDKSGNLAAGTSTGGMQGKKYGRVGDVPIIGAGTYANNASVAVSCTGHGEYFIREVVGHELSALVLYKGLSLQAAADELIQQRLAKMGGKGGLIAIDKSGNVHMPYNTPAMLRASKDVRGHLYVRLWQ